MNTSKTPGIGSFYQLSSYIEGLGWTDYVFFAGIWLRLCVFLFLSPFNYDSQGHYEHILYIRNHWSLPLAADGHETWQPPFYYIIAAVLSLWSGNPKFLQVFSLVTSIATLFVLRNLIHSNIFVKTKFGKLLALLMVCFLPELVIYSLQLSNDSLAIFLGFMAFYQATKLAADATTKNFLRMTVVLAIGLLTKGHFLIFGTFLFPFACLCYLRKQGGFSGNVLFFTATAVVVLAIGCSKYIQNTAHYGRAFICNADFDPPWLKFNQNTYKGLGSIFDINVVKLVRNPTFDESTVHSIPLVIYGTFWYQYFHDSNFQGDLLVRQKNIGRYMYIAGAFPAILLILGGSIGLRRLYCRAVSGRLNFSNDVILRICAVGIFVATIGMMLHLLFKYDAWVMLVSRHVFPALIGGFVLCDVAIDKVRLNVSYIFYLWEAAFLIGICFYFLEEGAIFLK